jgi:DASH complex subunit ASK1
MSRATAPSARPLSLTEELEKLEQSITLTLQGTYLPTLTSQQTELISNENTEIDHNFSRAHRIVTSSILPIVEQYAEHSKAVWEGSKVCATLLENNSY